MSTRTLRPAVGLLCVAIAALGEAGFSARAERQGLSVPLETAFAESVSEARLRRVVRELVALGPRMGGTPSGDRAAAHLQKQFAGLGLTSAIVDDAPLWASWAESWRLELARSGSPMASAHPFLFSPAVERARDVRLIHVTAPTAAEPSWEGAVLYTPAPIDTSDYRRIEASRHPPIAVITSAPHLPAKNPDWSRPGALPPGDNNPFPVFAVSYVDGRSLEAAAARGDRVTFSIAARTRRAPSRTVVATLGGADAERYYLVSAHGDSDSGGPGADDNASGVAAVLEIASLLSAQARNGALKPAVSVRFVVWGAEYHSARSYLDREGEAIERCLGVINFDQVGAGEEREAIYIEGNDVPWNTALVRLLEEVGADYLARPGFWPEFTTTPSLGGTDAHAFLPPAYQGRGYTARQIPATTIFTAAWDATRTVPQTPGWESKGWRAPGPIRIDYSRYYHSSADTPDNTTEREPQNMVRAARLAGIGLLRLLDP